MYHVILAGGSGTRFWPQSRQNKPKQLLNIISDETMIRMTVDRLKRFANPEHIMIVASETLCNAIQKEIPEIPSENFIAEPSGKNTAPAIGLAAIHIMHRDQDAVMGVYPADHLIVGDEQFETTIRTAEAMAVEIPSLITMGIKPTFPATGYGYIQFDQEQTGNHESINKVKQFTEKPPIDTARQFITQGDFLWNSGMFIWKAQELFSAIEKYMPDLFESLSAVKDFIESKNRYSVVLDREWELLQPESIDYGILEKAQNVYTIKALYEWSDLGSWSSVYDMLDKDQDQNVIKGDCVKIDTTNSLVISPARLTALIGMKNVAVINLVDTTMIMPLKLAEKVKDIVQLLQDDQKTEYL